MTDYPGFTFYGVADPDGHVFAIWIGAKYETREEAIAVRNSFPKSWRVHGGGIQTAHGTKGYVEMRIERPRSRTTGAENEQGLRRARSLFKRTCPTYKADIYTNQAPEAAVRALLEVGA